MTIKPVFFMIIKRKDVAVIHEIRQYIEDNLAKEIPVGSLCKKFGINRTKLQVGFNQLYGVSVHSFIHQARMNQARNLLADTEESIKVIAFENWIQEPQQLHTRIYQTASNVSDAIQEQDLRLIVCMYLFSADRSTKTADR